jgi:hypothetical protein
VATARHPLKNAIVDARFAPLSLSSSRARDIEIFYNPDLGSDFSAFNGMINHPQILPVIDARVLGDPIPR